MTTRLDNVRSGQLSDSALAKLTRDYTCAQSQDLTQAHYKHCPGSGELTTSTVQDQASSDTTSVFQIG
eukprot:2219528-Rhodomonas_salina.1